MKKILSLALAVLMLASMALSASAVSVLEAGGTKYITEVFGDKDTTVMKNLYSIIAKTSLGKYDYLDSLYTNWYDACPKCKGVALYYVKGGKICWQCLESDCDANGTVEVTAPEKEHKHESADTHCPDCGSDYFTTYLDTVIKDGKLVDQYFCGRCCILFYTNARDISATSKTVKCANKNCNKTAEFQYYSVDNGVLYANYRCAAGHEFRKLADAKYEEDDQYRVKVICTSGGAYSIYGGSYADYGEKKTITFEPEKGYVLTEVSVNGSAVTVKDNKLTITVKSNTTVRATFTAQKSVKNYAFTSTVNGRGKITVMKNDVKADAEKLTAGYNDTVTYRFVPYSKNYAVSDVKIDGKSVGKVASYTFDRIKGAHTVEVTFKWNNPFTDVKDSYLNAVEYVTEAGIMNAYKVTKNGVKSTCYFSGSTKITVKAFACALAEMADINDKLSTDEKRIEWAQKYGVIGKKWDLSLTCDVQTGCDMVKNYLEAIEDINGISFKNVKSTDTAKETAVKISLVTSNGYTKNRDLNRYDLAAICTLISTLPFTD